MTIAIKIENLSKHYRLGLVSTRTLSHDLNRWYQTTIRGKEDPYLKIGESESKRRSDGMTDKVQMTREAQMTPKANEARSADDYIWALRNINLEVNQGEVLGIIGKNGAGKSTLLKILSKVTAPTTGTIKARGRIASLLEVGTGFHPEMTGRENIFMNGAIMGMSKAEISRKLDQIVDFAGVETFIDTPVKRYSSGMTVRLGFAVAAHLEPEILIVDEVLAVGDAEFQMKAVGKMQYISKGEGRTVLFVSHNMASIENLCTRTILFNEGQLIKSGITKEIISTYLNFNHDTSKKEIWKQTDRIGNQQVTFVGIEYIVNQIEKVKSFSSGENIIIRVYFIKHAQDKIKNCRVSLAIKKDYISLIILSSDLVSQHTIEINKSGYIDFKIDDLPLSKGDYAITLYIEATDEVLDWIEDAAVLHVEDGNYYGTGRNYPTGWDGKTVLIKHSIEVIQ